MLKSVQMGVLLVAGVSFGIVFMLTCQQGPSDSSAQDSGTENGACCNYPVSMQSVPADQNPAQLLRGSADISTIPKNLAQGPLVLTDISKGSPSWAEFYLGDGTSCPDHPVDGDLLVHVDNNAHISGARYFVPAGRPLCMRGDYYSTNAEISWAGFIPY